MFNSKALLKFIFLLIIVCFYGCAGKSEDPAPSSNNPACTTCATCSDGIQNQGETGIDCGGPCAACDLLCDGNGENSYYPLALNNVWKYNTDTDTAAEYEIKVVTRTVMGTDVIFENLFDDYSLPFIFNIRKDDQGNVYSYPGPGDPGILQVPINPVLNQTWTKYPPYQAKIVSLNATVVTGSCTYTGCLQIDELDGTGTFTGLSKFYKKGVGLISEIYNGNNRDLIDVDLY